MGRGRLWRRCLSYFPPPLVTVVVDETDGESDGSGWSGVESHRGRPWWSEGGKIGRAW